jgi:hypothetical protein
MERLNAIPGVLIKPEWITQRPPIRLSVLTDEKKLSAFFDVMRWVIDEIRGQLTLKTLV